MVAKDFEGESLTLTWQGPIDDGGDTVANYIVEKRKAGTNCWVKVSSFCHAEKCLVTVRFRCVSPRILFGNIPANCVISQNSIHLWRFFNLL